MWETGCKLQPAVVARHKLRDDRRPGMYMRIMGTVTLTAFKEWPRVIIAVVYSSVYSDETTACSLGFISVECNDIGTAAALTTEILLLKS